MFNFAGRNLKIFLRQKSAVFFSLLGVFVIIGLYLVFLGDVWASETDLPGKDILMSNWIIAGIVSVASITTAMGGFGIMVEDRARKNSKDFFSSPISRGQIVGGYICSAYSIGVSMSLVAFILGELYIVASGGQWLSFLSMLQVLGVILVSAGASSTIVFFIVSFFFSSSAFTTASTVLGTLIGFVTGIYLPIGTLPDAVQWVIKLFPVSHASALLRQVMMKRQMAASFASIPEGYLTEFKEMVGITYSYGDYTATPFVHILVLLGTTVLFFMLALLSVSKKRNQ